MRLQGTIDRRILVNFRVRPDRLAAVLPEPFRPQLVGGYGMAGICLIRLRDVRPAWLPSPLGIGSENAAHRIAVEWTVAGQTQSGVYIPRRDTSSRLNAYLGGWLFPGEHQLARFEVAESASSLRVMMHSCDGAASVSVEGQVTDHLPTDSVFDSVGEASRFFECGSLGYSPNGRKQCFDGLELRVSDWRVQPLHIEQVHSDFFENEQLFPAGSVVFDNGLLMRGIHHQWHSREMLPMCEAAAAS
ncbi:MAG: DUF2071 domain-containing protein [Bythopirellula sp.]